MFINDLLSLEQLGHFFTRLNFECMRIQYDQELWEIIYIFSFLNKFFSIYVLVLRVDLVLTFTVIEHIAVAYKSIN